MTNLNVKKKGHNINSQLKRNNTVLKIGNLIKLRTHLNQSINIGRIIYFFFFYFFYIS